MCMRLFWPRSGMHAYQMAWPAGPSSMLPCRRWPLSRLLQLRMPCRCSGLHTCMPARIATAKGMSVCHVKEGACFKSYAPDCNTHTHALIAIDVYALPGG